MGKSKDMSWLPSGGVLVVAIGAGLVAAILVNVYVNSVRNDYETGSKFVLQMTEDVEKDTPIQARHIKSVMVPKPFIPSLKQAIKAEDKDSSVIGKKAQRRLYPGEFLFYPEFIPPTGQEAIENIPRGFALVTIPISGETPGSQLQPGAFVTVYGDFNLSGDPKREDIQILPVLENVRVKLIEGSASSVAERSHSYRNISILVRQLQAQQLLQIQKALRSRSYTITLSPRPEGPDSTEPVVNRQVLDLVEKNKPPASAPPPAPAP